MTNAAPLPESTAAQRDAFLGRLFESTLHAAEIFNAYVGYSLGFYDALAQQPCTAAELSTRSQTNERLTREWLEQQAVAGYLDVSGNGRPESRQYRLPAGHAEVLVNRDSLTYLAALLPVMAATARQLPAIVQSFRSGSGVPYAAYGAEAREAQSYLNRAAYLQLLGREWLPSITDLDRKLREQPAARVADIGCGAGWSAIAIARAYPNVQVDGFDSDAESIADATRNAVEAEVTDRVHFAVRDASDPALAGRYDLVVAFECVHDMGRPVQALATMKRLLAEGGSVVIMDENVAEAFTAPGEMVERFMYAFSPLYCLQQGLADGPEAHGTMMRPTDLQRYATAAGFAGFEVLPIQHDFWRFYRLQP